MTTSVPRPETDAGAALIERIRAGLIGEGDLLTGPYGPRRITYADYTASGPAAGLHRGRHPRPRAALVRQHPHREPRPPGWQTTRLRERRAADHPRRGRRHRRARGDLLRLGRHRRDRQAGRHPGPAAARRPCPAGTGCSARSRPERDRWSSSARTSTTPTSCPGASRSPTWSRSAPTARRALDLAELRPPAACATPTGRCGSGSFSAASNVTGILTDTDARRRHCCTRTARCRSGTTPPPPRTCPSAMRRDRGRARVDAKDAVFLSPHKFVGGPQTPGVLVVRRELFRNRVPIVPGGGTVAFVDPVGHRYLDDPVAREEGGTPAIVESIRAGLVFAAQAGRRHRRRSTAREERLWRRALQPLAAATRTRDPRQPRARAAADRVVPACARRRVPAPQLRRRAAQRPVRHPGPRRLLVRRPVRPPAARHRPGAFARVARPRSAAATRASSPAGSGSTSTTSSPTPSPTTSSTPSTSSPPADTGCSATTASTRTPGYGDIVTPQRGRRCAWPTCTTPSTATWPAPHANPVSGRRSSVATYAAPQR